MASTSRAIRFLAPAPMRRPSQYHAHCFLPAPSRPLQCRRMSRPRALARASRRASPPKTTVEQRGATSKEDTQTDLAQMDMLRSFAPPATSIEMCTADGFRLNNECEIGDGSGVMLIGGEGFLWRPWRFVGDEDKPGRLVNEKGQFEIGEGGWGILGLVWPKPDLLIVGTGRRIAPLAPSTRLILTKLGIRVEVQDTRNAAAQFNLLATERGVQQVGAAMIPIGWQEQT